MNVKRILKDVDELKPNAYSEERKTEWINTLEHEIYQSVIRLYEGYEQYEQPDITPESDPEQELIVPEPYARLYMEYVISQIDFYNREWEAYNNSANVFQQSYSEFRAYYGRNHMRKNVKLKNFM